ncbi:MAG: polyprenyl synthetase family protein [Candidatus Marsarchaeota archaeon]|jgi:geranylgeranyl diphosphate synthase type II|nr:polyprenyl synthetase family protein [Candidatus Marsarchaeota archaeon]
MKFKEYIESNRDAIYNTISRYLPVSESEEYTRMVRDYTDRQGSYRRPALLMLTGEMFGAGREELLLPAAAMQLSEDWILIHDDAEDDSELRRGKPALHKIYGIEQAVNAGDMAHMSMWYMLKEYIKKSGIEKGAKVYDKFYDLLSRTVEGQYTEIKFMKDTKLIGRADESLYLKIISSKTCYYTVYGPMQLGALIAGAGEKVLEALEEIGDPAGKAFQIVDDILDMTADEALFGKKRYGDLYEGKLTLIILHTYKNATEAEKREIDKIYGKDRRQKSKDEISFLVGLIEKYHGIEYAKAQAEKYGELAKEKIVEHGQLLPEGPYRETMASAMEDLSVRKK